jgi:GxxExxY protein
MALITSPQAEQIIGCAIRVHRRLGPGLFESVYEECLAYELTKAGLQYGRRVVVPVRYDDVVLPRAFVADLIVEGQILVELKSVQEVLPVHCKQVITYMRLSGLCKGLLFNFSAEVLKDGLRSFVLTK